jgi:hypothetical protein
MITLTIISFIYSILTLLRFKRIYGTYNFISEPPTLWTMILLWTILYNIAIIILLIIKYLP